MNGAHLAFRVSDCGRVWPPISTDGAILGFARKGSRRRMELFRVTTEGLCGKGIYYLWSDLSGLSITEGYVTIHSEKYPSGGVRFVLDGVLLITASGEEIRLINGYPVSYCLLNRITFERQKLTNTSTHVD